MLTKEDALYNKRCELQGCRILMDAAMIEFEELQADERRLVEEVNALEKEEPR